MFKHINNPVLMRKPNFTAFKLGYKSFIQLVVVWIWFECILHTTGSHPLTWPEQVHCKQNIKLRYRHAFPNTNPQTNHTVLTTLNSYGLCRSYMKLSQSVELLFLVFFSP